MENIKKINDTTVEIETTTISTRQISIDDLESQILNLQGDIDNATSAYYKQTDYLQTQIDDRNAQIESIKNLGVITIKEAEVARLAEIVTPMEEATTTDPIIN